MFVGQANALQFTAATAALCKALANALTAANCLAVWTADGLGPETPPVARLRAAAARAARRHFEAVAAGALFPALTETALVELCASDDVRARSEDAVYEAVSRWVAHDPDARRAPEVVHV